MRKLQISTSDEWLKKKTYIYTMEYYLVIKKNEIILLAGEWIELEIVMLSEVSQIQKCQDCVFPLICEASPER
jgi:hypothetical protein